MKRKWSWIALLVPGVLLVFDRLPVAANVTVATVATDKVGNGAFDLQVDPRADPKIVADQLRSSLQFPDGVTIDGPVKVDDKGIAHVAFKGATPESSVEVTLPDEVADATGVTGNPSQEKRRRAGYYAAGAAAAGGIIAGILIPGGDDNKNNQPTTSALSPVQ